MKKNLLKLFTLFLFVGVLVGCTGETNSTDEDGNKKREFTISETAIVENVKVKINSVKKVGKECSFTSSYDGSCYSWNEPEKDFFLIIDVTIENNNEKDISVSSIISFELKSKDGTKGSQQYSLNDMKDSLDGTVMPGDLLKGQVGYDVVESDEYYFYYSDSLFGNPIKFILKSSDISE